MKKIGLALAFIVVLIFSGCDVKIETDPSVSSKDVSETTFETQSKPDTENTSMRIISEKEKSNPASGKDQSKKATEEKSKPKASSSVSQGNSDVSSNAESITSKTVSKNTSAYVWSSSVPPASSDPYELERDD